MNQEELRRLQNLAIELKLKVLDMTYTVKTGHLGGSYSEADIVTALYFHEMNVRPEEPKWPERDRFVLSKGHAVPFLYATLAKKGYFPEETLMTLRQKGSILQGHPDMKRCPGLDVSSGSLGQGLSMGVGMAIAGKRENKDYRVFAMLGDGEIDEGQIWEAFMSARKYELDNLVIFLDHNGLQGDGTCDEIMPTLDMAEKMRAFGFDVWSINGNDMAEVVDVLDKARESRGNGKPKFIDAHTVKGNGVSFMENQGVWHSLVPNDEQYAQAKAELEGQIR